MFFKRSNGEFRETDRVTRFKLIKSGKNWLRASTSNFGLLKVIRGQVEETIVAEVREDAGMTGRSFLKGATVAVAVLSLASFVNTSYADELGKDEVVTSAVVSTPAVASEPAALNEQDSKEVLETLNESATETPASTAPSSELVETVPASDDKTILEQNASEAALLNKIAEKYASNHQNTEQKEAINDAVAKVQSELTAGDKLTDTDATAQTYADQRERLSKSVDDMMATLIAAGFEGNTTVNGAPAISAQLDALSTSNTLTAPSVSPTMDQPNGAAIEDPAWNNANYKLDPSADRYTYSIWDLQNWAGPANQGGVTYSNGGYYVTFSVDRATTGTTEAPKVHARLVEKATGKEVEALDMTAKSTYQFKTLVKENPTYAPVFDYTLGEYAQILGTWDNNRDAGPTADDKYKHHILQVLDLAKPGNEGSTKPNVQTKIPREKITHTTYYKVEGTNEELASYSQAGIESQNYKASQPRSFEGYEYTRTDDKKDMSGVLGGIGAKYLELQGGRAHYYVKRIVEQIATDGTSVVKLYALDPSKVSSYNPATDVNTLDLSNYTLVYTSDPVKPGEKPTPAGTAAEPKEVGFVDSKDGQYYLKVATYTASDGGNARLSGWFNKATGDAFTASPQFSADVDPVRNNKSNIIGGNTPGDKASGYPSFFNNFSLPTVKEISTNVTHYYRKSDVKGNVYVHYKDTEGKTIKNSVTAEEQQPINKHYETQGRRPQEIEFQGKTYELVPAGAYKVGEVDEEGHLKSSDPTTGEVAKEDKNVTYIYKLKEKPKGEVVITYVDEKGKEIQKPRQDTPNSPYDTPYNTTEEGEKPNTIEKDGKTYKIVPKGDYPVGKVDGDGHLESSDPIKGKVAKPISTITYVYKEEVPKGEVVITYVDEKGTELQKPRQDTPNSPYDTPYNTTEEGEKPNTIEKDGKTYTIVPKGDYPVGKVDEDGHLESSDPIKGKVAKPISTITYVYKLKEEPKGEVVITYVDEKGTELQKSRQDTPNSPYDTPYNTTEEGEKPNTIEKDGKTYTIVPKGDYPVGKVDEDGHLESSDPIKGKVAKPISTITYVYKLKVEPTPDKPVEPTPDKPVEPTPDKPVEPTPDKPVEPTPDKPVEPTPDKPVEPTPNKPVDPTPGKPVNPTPGKPVNPTPGKPVDPTPGKPVDPTPGKPVNPTPGKPVNPTPGKPVDPTPGKPVDPTPGKPVDPTPGKPVNPTPGKPVNPTPGKPVNPTPGKPVDPTPGKPVDPTPGKPVDPTPGKPVNPTPGKPVDPTPGKPVNPTPGKPVNPTPSKPVSEQPANPTSDKAQLPNTGETKSAGSTVLGVVAGLVGLAALGRRKKEDEK